MAYNSYSDYNPYTDVQNVYNAKVAWNQATTDEERQKQNEIATKARKNLEMYGYGDIAEQISASGADATKVRQIMEKYAPVAPTGTKLSDSELMTAHNNEIRNKTNQLYGTQVKDRNTMANKYDRLEETAYSNPFTTDEAKAILGKYSLAGLQGRDNAVASGSASNGGNIDSYAAANALRQQASLINQGQMAVLESHNNKINNVKGILEGLGVYQQNQDVGMQNTIQLQQNESQRLFDNDQTAKNNDVDRKVKIAGVTGYTPTEWTYDKNIYLNSDGTVKDVYLTDEFDNTGGFTTIINNAKEKLKTTTDATERANLQATINYATQAKALKTFGDAKYSQYAHEVEGIAPERTSEHYLTEKQIDSGEKIAIHGNEAALEETKLNNQLAEKQINAGLEETRLNNANAKELMQMEIDAAKDDELVDVVPIGSINEERMSAANVDEFGRAAIEGLIRIANEDGPLTKEDVYQYLVQSSGTHKTNKDQLEKVSNYLGIGTLWLNDVENVNEDQSNDGWQKGVMWKTN